MTTYSIDQLAQMIDHTNLKPYASREDMKTLCEEAKAYHFKMVAINQVQSALCHEYLADSDVAIGAAISFPLGQTSIAVKVFETKNAIEIGATEIDYVINLTEVKAKNWAYLKDEMQQIVAVCRENQVISKVIFENAYLTEEEKIALCHIAKEVEPDFIKTSTGFAPSGATFEDVKLMKEQVGPKVKIKAAGGIRDAETFKKMLACGAERIGTSSGMAIIDALKEEAANGEITL
ncbi:deoxyribose-phosphate aldolase [Enterococcus pallens]|uniref:Deoxyribose-phosphate aldolase n=1 Tax=Enterococcus pallens ATCC BAA-351 TaxID=1158607 RepID=R2SFW3_9ENTE|nr:deoxyribose-phosphate aldolase [Enterococcus pallens]EOH91786.1 deoxyribose-phosphate aldolase [Enterococcus pallens ATCC BAA-351]EOU25214.1 deoxyribose-phosphate aldolase [Enterococcus pallens ATCC BAA-351]OJG79987.1 deoxyribose-phosphate aldolase [Enterococcus pallens]